MADSVPMPGTIQLLLGRHGPHDHYLGGRYLRPQPARRPRILAFPLSGETVHLFESIVPSQLREPVPANRILDSFASRYGRTALAFAQRVEAAGGKNYNAESRPTPEADREYEELRDAALRADLAFFKRPVWERYHPLAEAEERFGALRESLIEANLEHFAARGSNVVARLGRVHSRARRIARRGFPVRTQIGVGVFFPEQVLKRRAVFGLAAREEDRMRAYVDRLLRLLPAWEPRLELPPRRRLLALQGERLAVVHQRFDAAAREARSLPELRDLLRILREVEER